MALPVKPASVAPASVSTFFQNIEDTAADHESRIAQNTADIAGIVGSDVESVNGATGAVVLDAGDVGADVAGAAAAAQAASQPLDADLTALAGAGNSAVLAATTASFLTADESKLDALGLTIKGTTADYIGTVWTQTTQGTTATLDRIYYTPLVIDTATPVDAIACALQANGGATARLRMNLYSSTVTGRPNARLGTDQDCNSATAGDAPGMVPKTFVMTLQPGLYWLACAAQGANGLSPVFYQGNSAPIPLIPNPNPANATAFKCFFEAQSGAFPATATPSGPTTSAPPMIFLRRA